MHSNSASMNDLNLVSPGDQESLPIGPSAAYDERRERNADDSPGPGAVMVGVRMMSGLRRQFSSVDNVSLIPTSGHLHLITATATTTATTSGSGSLVSSPSPPPLPPSPLAAVATRSLSIRIKGPTSSRVRHTSQSSESLNINSHNIASSSNQQPSAPEIEITSCDLGAPITRSTSSPILVASNDEDVEGDNKENKPSVSPPPCALVRKKIIKRKAKSRNKGAKLGPAGGVAAAVPCGNNLLALEPSTLRHAASEIKLNELGHQADKNRLAIRRQCSIKNQQHLVNKFHAQTMAGVLPTHWMACNGNMSRHIGPKFKLIHEGEIQVCRLNHHKTIISKILSSKFLRRWETHKLQLTDSQIMSKTVSSEHVLPARIPRLPFFPHFHTFRDLAFYHLGRKERRQRGKASSLKSEDEDEDERLVYF